ncbi:hypothetical protein EON71_00350 [bacterium]|nr:MAG: hypothetical protein EON71_00350 [bacterium]
MEEDMRYYQLLRNAVKLSKITNMEKWVYQLKETMNNVCKNDNNAKNQRTLLMSRKVIINQYQHNCSMLDDIANKKKTIYDLLETNKTNKMSFPIFIPMQGQIFCWFPLELVITHSKINDISMIKHTYRIFTARKNTDDIAFLCNEELDFDHLVACMQGLFSLIGLYEEKDIFECMVVPVFERNDQNQIIAAKYKMVSRFFTPPPKPLYDEEINSLPQYFIDMRRTDVHKNENFIEQYRMISEQTRRKLYDEDQDNILINKEYIYARNNAQYISSAKHKELFSFPPLINISTQSIETDNVTEIFMNNDIKLRDFSTHNIFPIIYSDRKTCISPLTRNISDPIFFCLGIDVLYTQNNRDAIPTLLSDFLDQNNRIYSIYVATSRQNDDGVDEDIYIHECTNKRYNFDELRYKMSLLLYICGIDKEEDIYRKLTVYNREKDMFVPLKDHILKYTTLQEIHHHYSQAAINNLSAITQYDKNDTRQIPSDILINMVKKAYGSDKIEIKSYNTNSDRFIASIVGNQFDENSDLSQQISNGVLRIVVPLITKSTFYCCVRLYPQFDRNDVYYLYDLIVLFEKKNKNNRTSFIQTNLKLNFTDFLELCEYLAVNLIYKTEKDLITNSLFLVQNDGWISTKFFDTHIKKYLKVHQPNFLI